MVIQTREVSRNTWEGPSTGTLWGKRDVTEVRTSELQLWKAGVIQNRFLLSQESLFKHLRQRSMEELGVLYGMGCPLNGLG